jgi:hypothetical protein
MHHKRFFFLITVILILVRYKKLAPHDCLSIISSSFGCKVNWKKSKSKIFLSKITVISFFFATLRIVLGGMPPSSLGERSRWPFSASCRGQGVKFEALALDTISFSRALQYNIKKV